MIGLVTDSNSQIPPGLARRYGIEVVPLTVTVGGVSHAEGEDLDADRFWASFGTAAPEVTTSQPSPGRFAAAYAAVAARGADEILSVHIGSALSGTVNSARLAAASAPVPVHVVDTATASFAVTCCVWEAAEALAGGATVAAAAAVAQAVGAAAGTVWVVGALEPARAGGRLAPDATPTADSDAGIIPVLTLAGGAMEVVRRVDGVGNTAEAMADHVRAAGTSLRVGVGHADAATAPLAHALERRLVEAPEVLDVVRYRVGPSVGAHTGPGTVGAVYYRTTAATAAAADQRKAPE